MFEGSRLHTHSEGKYVYTSILSSNPSKNLGPVGCSIGSAVDQMPRKQDYVPEIDPVFQVSITKQVVDVQVN